MNTTFFPAKCKQIIQVFSLYLIFFLFASPVFSQAVIFKRDGTRLEVSRIDREGRTRSYNFPNDTTGMIHYIGNSAIDSIRFADGTVQRFLPGKVEISLEAEEEIPVKLRKNIAGVNVWPFFSAHINFFYERLFLKNKIGFKNYFTINTQKENIYAGTLNERAESYYSAGINYYFLQSEMFRFGTGASYLTGKFKGMDSYYDENGSYIENSGKASGLLLNASFWGFLNDRWCGSIVLEFPVDWKSMYTGTFLRTELAIKF